MEIKLFLLPVPISVFFSYNGIDCMEMKLFPLPVSVSVLFDIIKSGGLICRFYSDNQSTNHRIH
jgi:hypothetical protein